MTEQVRTTYRSHRKAAWALAIALVLGLAAIAIPIASGAADKTYALEFAATTPVLPAPGTSGNGALIQNLCTDTDYTAVTLTLKNTAPTSTLGSANVTFPTSVVTLSGNPSFSPSGPSGATVTRSPNSNVVSLRGLNLPKRNGTVSFSIALSTKSTPTTTPVNITAQVKQSNDFSDSGSNPDANGFENPAPASILKIALQACTTTISGRIYHNRNADLVYTQGTGNFDTSDLPKTWRLDILSKLPSGSTYTLMSPQPPRTQDSTDGTYTVTVPSGRDYKVCVVATASTEYPDDDDAAWGLQAPSGNTDCARLSATSAPESAGYFVAASALPASGKDFIAVPATPSFGPGNRNAIPGYEVIAGLNGTKDPTYYTQEVWKSGNNVNFRFAPITDCVPADADCSKIHLIEMMTTDIALSDLNGSQVTLKYDDSPPFEDAGPTGLKEMPYCLRDPRPDDWGPALTDNRVLDVNPPNTLATAVLPGSATSCILEGHQTVITGGKVRVTYIVYTSYDGGRQIGVG
jgi:hypothetical protein